MTAKGLHFVLNIVSTLAIIHYLDPGAYGQYVPGADRRRCSSGCWPTSASPSWPPRGGPRLRLRAQVLGTVLAARVVLAFIALGVVQVLLLALGAPPRPTRRPPSPR
jgi:hypothetical protein